MDGKLWRDKYLAEGWALKSREIDSFEAGYNSRRIAAQTARESKAPRSPTDSRAKTFQAFSTRSRLSKRKERANTLQDSEEDAEGHLPRLTIPRKSQDSGTSQDQDMSGVERSQDARDEMDLSSPFGRDGVQDSPDGSESDANTTLANIGGPRSPETPLSPADQREGPLVLPGLPGRARLNYHHIYKQKRRLEENWNLGKYKIFQLPHRDHPEDAHLECVYTIQYAGRYLVSGSRDWTLRIWDLDTQRLARAPLQGHKGSVLCLQFDNTPEEDVIISGSSDTHVILWRFSTGKMIRQISNAHRESVLNLRFDKRFLVTCSKDKTIKIWNRNELRPGDRDYPVKGVRGGGECPSYIIDASNIAQALKFGPPRSDYKMLLEPYEHLMTLDAHGAAVNAIQIYADQLVSASGDRCLRIWDIHTGECTTRIEAHSKGIACVQYDGKRIVSGSSDNTIRIWDPVSHIEVARLEGHSRLVRTIQAAFADVPGGRERLEEEAAQVDVEFRKAQKAGLIIQSNRRGPPPVPGSRRPQDLRGVNAKIPPSGGGGRWSHIVSGSYDETVIIWKKTADDEWVVGHKLRQEDALTAAGPDLSSRTLSRPPRPDDFNTQLTRHIDRDQTQDRSAALRSALSRAAAQHAATTAPRQGSSSSTEAGPSTKPVQPTTAGTITHAQAPPGMSNIALPPRPLPNAARPARPGPPQAATGQPNARVFKLQFDARRIICCSQDPKIVGWDFANGDAEIIECSRFFATPEY